MIPNKDGSHNDDDSFSFLFYTQEWFAEEHDECYKSNQKATDDKNDHFKCYGLCLIRKYLLEPPPLD